MEKPPAMKVYTRKFALRFTVSGGYAKPSVEQAVIGEK
jgi:hypothetical protein